MKRQYLISSPLFDNTRVVTLDNNYCDETYNDFLRNVLQKLQLLEPSKTTTSINNDFFTTCNSTRFQLLQSNGRYLSSYNFASFQQQEQQLLNHENNSSSSSSFCTTTCLSLSIPIVGGMDRQNRVGSKFGGGGVSSAQQSERERKERLKQLALESIDLAKDPYLMRNHLGTYECKLCLTLHTNEANYLAHTQGKKHQQGLAKRAYMEKKYKQQNSNNNNNNDGDSTVSLPAMKKQKLQQQLVKIGRPAYQVFKSRDPDTNQRCLSFELSFPEINTNYQPRHRFMSAYEQRIDNSADRRKYQYLLFAAMPYETVAFKIPNEPIDKGEGRFVTHWNEQDKVFTLTLYFMEQEDEKGEEKEEENGEKEDKKDEEKITA